MSFTSDSPIGTSGSVNGEISSLSNGTATSSESTSRRGLEVSPDTIESAYRRIRQVRRNLLNIMDSIPDNTSEQRSSEGNEIEPIGEAAMSNGTLEDLDDMRPEMASVSLMEERLRRIERRIESDLRAANLLSEFPSLSTGQDGILGDNTDNMNSSAFSRSRSNNGYPARVVRPLTQTPPQRMEDASTSLGRRVVARETSGPSTTTPMGRSDEIFPRSDDYDSFVAALEVEIDNFRALALQRRSNVSSENLTENPRGSSPEVYRGSPIRRGLYVPGVYTAEEYRRHRTYGTPNGPSPPFTQPSERLSLLSNISVQNLPTPDSANLTRPLIFEEPTSYAGDNTRQSPDNRDERILNSHNNIERSYVIRRRFNADGEELVYPINLDWINEESPTSWLLPRRNLQTEPLSEHSNPPVRHRRRSSGRPTPTSVSTEATQRRHGSSVTTRLDPDGDEINAEDDEECFEPFRIPQRFYLRMASRGSTTAATSGNNSRSGTDTGGGGSTRGGREVTTIPPDDESDLHPERAPRVRLNNGQIRRGSRRRHATSTMDGTGTTTTTTTRAGTMLTGFAASSSVGVFRPDPLPMPLESMTWFWARPRPKVPRSAAMVLPSANFASR